MEIVGVAASAVRADLKRTDFFFFQCCFSVR